MEKYIFITDYQAQPIIKEGMGTLIKVKPRVFKKGEVVEGNVSQSMDSQVGNHNASKVSLLKFDEGYLEYTIPLGLNSPLEKILIADLPKTNPISVTGKTDKEATNNVLLADKKTKTLIISLIVGVLLLYGAYRLGKRK